MIKYLYSVFLAFLIALFVGTTLAFIFPAPEYPEYNYDTHYSEDYDYEAEDKLYQERFEIFQDEQDANNRNIALISLGVAVLLIVAGLSHLTSGLFFQEGIMLGGIFTLIYSLIISSTVQSELLMLGVTATGLVATLAVGQLRHDKKVRTKSKIKSKK